MSRAGRKVHPSCPTNPLHHSVQSRTLPSLPYSGPAAADRLRPTPQTHGGHDHLVGSVNQAMSHCRGGQEPSKGVGNNESPEVKFLTAQQVSEVLQVSLRTVWRLARESRLPRVRIANGNAELTNLQNLTHTTEKPRKHWLRSVFTGL